MAAIQSAREVTLSRRQVLLACLRVALECSERNDPILGNLDGLSTEDWAAIYLLANQQTVTGLLQKSVELLDAPLPEDLSISLMIDAEKIEKRAKKVRTLADRLVTSLRKDGFYPVVFKGPSVAAYYPDPDLRVSGDLDLYIPGNDFPKMLDWFDKREISYSHSPDGSCQCNLAGISVDIHSHFYDLSIEESELPPVSSPEGTLLMLSSHILKHAMGPGVGLRQICDMAMAYRALEGFYDKATLLSLYEKTGILKWNRLLSGFIESSLKIKTPVPDADRYSKRLETILFAGGDFGHHSKSRMKGLSHGGHNRKVDTALRFVYNLPFSMRYAPRELFFYTKKLLKGNLN